MGGSISANDQEGGRQGKGSRDGGNTGMGAVADSGANKNHNFIPAMSCAEGRPLIESNGKKERGLRKEIPKKCRNNEPGIFAGHFENLAARVPSRI